MCKGTEGEDKYMHFYKVDRKVQNDDPYTRPKEKTEKMRWPSYD